MSWPSLSMTREALTEEGLTFIQTCPLLLPLVLACLELDPLQFWLHCTTMLAVISTVQAGDGECVVCAAEGIIAMVYTRPDFSSSSVNSAAICQTQTQIILVFLFSIYYICVPLVLACQFSLCEMLC